MSIAEVDVEEFFKAVDEQKPLGLSTAKINYYIDGNTLHLYYKPIHDILLHFSASFEQIAEFQASKSGMSLETSGVDALVQNFLYELKLNYPSRRILGYKQASTTVEVRAVDG